MSNHAKWSKKGNFEKKTVYIAKSSLLEGKTLKILFFSQLSELA